MKLVIKVLSVLLIFPTLSLAQAGEVFTLAPTNSAVSFEIKSSIFPIEGKITKYSGNISSFGKLPTQQRIILDCNLSSIQLTGEKLQGLPVSELLSSLQNSNAHFEGKPVSLRKDGSYQVEGVLKWRGKAYDVSFPVRLERTGDEIQFVGKVSGSGEELVEELPPLMLFQVQSASANAKLVFKKQAQMNTRGS
jgi:polyisoprenoid-binding protein YceI